MAFLAPALHAAPATTTLEEFAASSPHGPSLAAAVEQARHAARRVEYAPGQWWAQNPANGLNARFTPEGLSMGVSVAGADGGKRHLSTLWRTVGVGYGENLAPVGAGEVSASAEPGRVEIARPGLVEWFVNRPGGLEHGWTLQAPPGNPNSEMPKPPLRVEMALEGDLLAEVSADGQQVVLRDVDGTEALRYGKLKVWDAEGQTLVSRMVGGGTSLAVEVEDAGAVYPLTIDPTFSQQAYLKASNTWHMDHFGESVAIDGDTVVVGAPEEDSAATGVNGNQSDGAHNSGAAYVFVRSGTSWSQQAYLKASNTGVADHFGHSVAIFDDTIVVGAPYEDSAATGVNGNQSSNGEPSAGAVYVFVRNGATWMQQAYLKASNAERGDGFGASVSISGDAVIIGAPYEDISVRTLYSGSGGPGAAYVFVRNGATWSQQAYLKASNAEWGDGFGASVSISGDAVVVGAPNEDSAATGVNGNQGNGYNYSTSLSGAAYVFVRSGATWSQHAYLKASNTGKDDVFGASVAISGDTIVVGAPGESSAATGANADQNDDSTRSAGAAYVFVRSGATWTQQAYLKGVGTGLTYPYLPGFFHEFGGSVAISGRTIIVGAPWDADESQGFLTGSAYIFTRNGRTWSQQSRIKVGVLGLIGSGAGFGGSVAICGGTAVVGARDEKSDATGVNGDQNDYSGSRSGAAYVFEGSDSAPSFAVFGNGVRIPNGEATPSLYQYSDFGSVV